MKAGSGSPTKRGLRLPDRMKLGETSFPRQCCRKAITSEGESLLFLFLLSGEKMEPLLTY